MSGSVGATVVSKPAINEISPMPVSIGVAICDVLPSRADPFGKRRLKDEYELSLTCPDGVESASGKHAEGR